VRPYKRGTGSELTSFDEHVEGARKNSSENWTGPVDPMVRCKSVRYHSGAEGSRRVNAATGVIYAHELGDEQRKSNADRSNKRAFVLLGSKHENGEDQLRCQEHL